ncbi:hypothetical protein INR49_011495 [Caranx melampygus]|nr:hypothetical protein INR49_011495 [Caranx melampygus]
MQGEYPGHALHCMQITRVASLHGQGGCKAGEGERERDRRRARGREEGVMRHTGPAARSCPVDRTRPIHLKFTCNPPPPPASNDLHGNPTISVEKHSSHSAACPGSELELEPGPELPEPDTDTLSPKGSEVRGQGGVVVLLLEDDQVGTVTRRGLVKLDQGTNNYTR